MSNDGSNIRNELETIFSSHGIKFGTVGYEVILLYLAGLVALAIGGAGPLSIDRWRARRKAAPAR